MTEEKLADGAGRQEAIPFRFGAKTLAGVVFAMALIFGAYRVDPLYAALAAWAYYAALLLVTARRVKYSPSIIVAMCLQGALGSFMECAPIGFDHKSEWGLDFGHFLLLALCYSLALLQGMAAATWRRQWRPVGIQLFGLGILLAPFVIPFAINWLGLTRTSAFEEKF